MTAPEFKRGVRYWLVPVLATIAVLGVAVEFMLLIPLLREQGVRAAQGRQARVQQCKFRGVTLREQAWFRDQGVIGEREFVQISGLLPSLADCRVVLSK